MGVVLTVLPTTPLVMVSFFFALPKVPKVQKHGYSTTAISEVKWKITRLNMEYSEALKLKALFF